jgi:lysophospholipid acyltransferase (LPLAT)-like uncharacterized protein
VSAPVLRRLPARQRIKAALIAAAATPIIEALGASWRFREQGVHPLDRIIREGRQPIYALWHGRILAGTIYLRERGIVVMTSENFDGEWVARIIRRFGFDPARGSTSRGGGRAMVRMRRQMRQGRPAAFTIDGPRGPARVVQPGAVWLASVTGNPVLPLHLEASSFWTVRSWDRHQIPKPRSAVAVTIGAPIDVPAGVTEARIASACQELEVSLADLERDAVRLAHQESH